MMVGMKNNQVSLVIFDMDGVIADTTRAHKLAWREYLQNFDRKISNDEFLSIFGMGNKELCNHLFPGIDLDAKKIRKIGVEKEALFRLHARGLLTTYSGFFEFLDFCDNKGIVMAVGSSACRKNVDFVLEELGITHRFAATVSADDVENAKPEPDIFLKAASITGTKPENALIFEDTPIGIRAAAAAGIRVGGLTTTHRAEQLCEADYVAVDFLEMRELTFGAESA